MFYLCYCWLQHEYCHIANFVTVPFKGVFFFSWKQFIVTSYLLRWVKSRLPVPDISRFTKWVSSQHTSSDLIEIFPNCWFYQIINDSARTRCKCHVNVQSRDQKPPFSCQNSYLNKNSIFQPPDINILSFFCILSTSRYHSSYNIPYTKKYYAIFLANIQNWNRKSKKCHIFQSFWVQIWLKFNNFKSVTSHHITFCSTLHLPTILLWIFICLAAGILSFY